MKNEDLSVILKTALKAEPNFRLSSDFAQKVTQSIARHEQWKADLTDYFYLLATLSLLIILLAGSYYLADKAFLIRIVTFLKLYPVPVLFVIFILNFILLTDRVLLRLLFNRGKQINNCTFPFKRMYILFCNYLPIFSHGLKKQITPPS